MRLIKNLLCAFMVALIGLSLVQTAYAADSEWYWINSDDKYSKYFSMTRINTVSSQNGIPTCIEDWIKTGYAPGGAAEAIANMKLPINDPNQLSYSLALVRMDPQQRTFWYMEEIFYDKDGKALYTLRHQTPIKKEINSQSFDEKFYAMIVDRVFNKGEGGRLIAKDRWLTLWQNSSGTSSADTATLRKVGDNAYVWIWQENKNADGQTVSINFMKKEYNLQNMSAATLNNNYWGYDTGWVDKSGQLDKTMHSIIPESSEDAEFAKIKQYVADNLAWASRYQLDAAPAAATVPSADASVQTSAPAKTDNATSPAAKSSTNPIGSVGPIGAPQN